MRMRGEAGPSSRASRVMSSTGVACGASGIDGIDINAASAEAMSLASYVTGSLSILPEHAPRVRIRRSCGRLRTVPR